jgi:transposase-like protein
MNSVYLIRPMLHQKEASMTISKELLDELLRGVERPEDLRGDARLMKELKAKLMERMLVAELTSHPGYEEGENAPTSQND